MSLNTNRRLTDSSLSHSLCFFFCACSQNEFFDRKTGWEFMSGRGRAREKLPSNPLNWSPIMDCAATAMPGRDPDRQVSLFAVETLREIQNEGFEVSAGSLSANLFTENIDLDSLNPGARLRIGEAVIEIAEARKPCRSITKIDNRLPKRLFGQCGQVGRVVKSGLARVGDEVEIMI